MCGTSCVYTGTVQRLFFVCDPGRRDGPEHSVREENSTNGWDACHGNTSAACLIFLDCAHLAARTLNRRCFPAVPRTVC
jgi:hypothetical protein